jgi:hypothetical protein
MEDREMTQELSWSMVVLLTKEPHLLRFITSFGAGRNINKLSLYKLWIIVSRLPFHTTVLLDMLAS